MSQKRRPAGAIQPQCDDDCAFSPKSTFWRYRCFIRLLERSWESVMSMADIGLQSNGDDHGSSHHDADSLRNQESTAQHAASNPFTTPYSSRPSSPQASTSGYAAQDQPRYFRSRRVQKGTIEQPWLDRKDPKEKWVTIIPLLGICVGLMVTALLIWDGLRSVVNHKYCIVLDEQWANGFDEKIWTKEVALGGYG